MDWGLLFIFLKGVFLVLVYLVLVILLITVLREMRIRLPKAFTSDSSVYIGRLRVLEPGSDHQLRKGSFLILRPDTTIGSKPGNTIILRDQFVSGNHACLSWDGVSWSIEDMDSTNGTYVNNMKIPAAEPVPLPNGAVVKVGDVLLEMVE